MPTFVKPRGRGRSPRNRVDQLRTRMWLHVVKLRSGLPSGYAIELALEPHLVRRGPDGVIRPRKWDAYEKGSRVPQRMAGKTYAVELAEAHYPGTASVFDSPLWAVLKGERLTRIQIDDRLRALGSDVVAVLFEKEEEDGRANRWRSKEFDQAAAACLARIGTFDALVATVLLMAKSEAIALPALREVAFDCYLSLQPAVERLPEVAPFAKEIFWAIDTTCKQWVFPTTQSRLDVVIFSHEIRKRAADDDGASDPLE